MKQTIAEMKAALDAFEKDKEVEQSYNNGVSWAVTEEPSWDFYSAMYRPVQTPQVVKYLCYENKAGTLLWQKEGSQDQLFCSAREENYTRVPGLDKEVAR